MPVPDRLSAEFDSWCCNALFDAEARDATRLLNRYCDLHLLGLYRELGLAERLGHATTSQELVREYGLTATADVTLRDALRRLAERTGVVRASGPPLAPRFVHVRAPDDPAPELVQVRAAIEALGHDYTAATDFIDFGRANFLRALRDEPEMMDEILSGAVGDFAELWHRATNVDPLQDLHGAMGARVAAQLLDGGTLLEIGGGTGNGARHLMRHLEATGAQARLRRYIYTDISVRFLLSSKHELGRAHRWLEWSWQFLDLNQPFAKQKVEPESVDLVYAVNAAHVASDIVGFLEQCRAALRPGGHVVFAERVRVSPYEMAPRELTLNLSIYHRTAAEHASYRPMHCYLAPSNWHDVLRRAGFSSCQILPDLDAQARDFPDRYAAVVVGSR